MSVFRKIRFSKNFPDVKDELQLDDCNVVKVRKESIIVPYHNRFSAWGWSGLGVTKYRAARTAYT